MKNILREPTRQLELFIGVMTAWLAGLTLLATEAPGFGVFPKFVWFAALMVAGVSQVVGALLDHDEPSLLGAIIGATMWITIIFVSTNGFAIAIAAPITIANTFIAIKVLYENS